MKDPYFSYRASYGIEVIKGHLFCHSRYFHGHIFCHLQCIYMYRYIFLIQCTCSSRPLHDSRTEYDFFLCFFVINVCDAENICWSKIHFRNAPKLLRYWKVTLKIQVFIHTCTPVLINILKHILLITIIWLIREKIGVLIQHEIKRTRLWMF